MSIPISIEYQPFEKIPYAFKKHGSIPDSWPELSPKQFLAIIRSINGLISENKLFRILTQFPSYIFKYLDDYHQYCIANTLEKLMETSTHDSFLIPEIKIRNRKFHAPAQRLKGMTFGQFIYIESYYSQYANTKKREFQNKLFASLYLTDNAKFNENQIEQNGPLFDKLKMEYRKAIFTNYLLVKTWLIKAYPLVFVEKQVNPQKPQKPVLEDTMQWAKIYESLMGDNIIDSDKYSALPIHTVLRFMTRKIKEQSKQKS